MSEAPQVARAGPVGDGLARVVDEMERRDIDVLLLGREANARFVSGAVRLWLAGTRPFAPGCVVVRATGDVHLLSITDDGVPASIPVAHLYSITWNPMKLVGSVAAIPGVADARHIGVDGLSPLFAQLLTGAFPAAELLDGNDLMRAVRRVKTADEVRHIRAAAAVAERALAAAVESLSPTVDACVLTGIALEAMARQGVTTPAFEPVFTIDMPRDLVTARVGVLARGWEGSLARTYGLATGAPRAPCLGDGTTCSPTVHRARGSPGCAPRVRTAWAWATRRSRRATCSSRGWSWRWSSRTTAGSSPTRCTSRPPATSG